MSTSALALPLHAEPLGSMPSSTRKSRKKLHRSPSTSGDESDKTTRNEDVCELCAATSSSDLPSPPTDLESLSLTLQARLDLTNASTFHRRSPIVISFYCKCTQVYGFLHQLYMKTQTNGAQAFQEPAIQKVGDWILPLFPLFFQSTITTTSSPSNRSSPSRHGKKKSHAHANHHHHRHTKASIVAAPTPEATCPFVMLISILLPSLRKLLAWTVVSRSQWKLPPSSLTSTAILATFSPRPKDPNDPAASQETISPRAHVHAMMELHHVLTRVAFDCDRIAQIIEINEEADHDDQGPASTVGAVQPSAGTSLLTQHGNGLPLRRIPQIKKISLEFQEVLAEIKIQLGELTEVILETIEMIASRLCRPLGTKESSKNRHGSALDFVQLLVQFVLEPIAERVVPTPSTSRLYLFHRMVDKCVSVAIGEFVTDNIKMNEILAAQIEKAIAHLKDWCSKTEKNFQTLHNSTSSTSVTTSTTTTVDPSATPATAASTLSEHPSDHEQGDISACGVTATSICPSPYQLNLLGIDSMRRLDHILNAWLRAHSKHSDGLISSGSRAGAKLKETIRTTIGRSRSQRHSNMTKGSSASSNIGSNTAAAPVPAPPTASFPAAATASAVRLPGSGDQTDR